MPHLARLMAVVPLAMLLVQSAESPAYRNRTLPVEVRVRDLLARMTLEEKFWQLFMIPGDLDNPANDYSHGIFGLQIGTARREAGGATPPAGALARAHAERINAIQKYFVEKTRLGIPILPFEEAVHGLTREGATAFPAAIALAATFDPDLMSRVATAIAAETRSRGIRDVLSPVINIADDVRWGRVEETYGEDPHLSSVMGVAFIKAFESAGVVTTPKHFIANVGEGGRDSYPIEHSERWLAERHFPPFIAAIREGGARSVMTAYNSIDGSPATQNRRLLNGILKGEWGFKGFVISDASATSGATVLHMTEANTASAARNAFNAGLDVVFQSQYGQQRPYLDAFQRGLIPADVIDAAVARVLRVKFEVGLFEDPYVDVEKAAAVNGSAAHGALAREAARASIVLLKNGRPEGLPYVPSGPTLPFSKSLRSVAVIGVDAEEARLGGYSGPGTVRQSILDGIRQALGGADRVRYAAGPGRTTRDLAVVPADALVASVNGQDARGLRGEYFANPRFEGAPALTRTDQRIDFRWTLNSPGRGIPFDWYSARWTGSIVAPAAGAKRIGLEGNDGYRLWLDDTLVIDNWQKRSFSRRTADITLAPSSRHAIKIEFFEPAGNARLRLLWDAGVTDDSTAAIDAAVTAARQSDAVVLVAGLEEGEFRDRAKLSLPGRQEELIQAVAATGKPVAVVIIGGSAVTMSPWIDRVGAVLAAWYPGEAGGAAVADVLFGDANPAGRLPITFPVFEGQLPLTYNHKPTGRGDDYVDLTGMPLFPFGFGLSYTTFEYSQLEITPTQIGPLAVPRGAARPAERLERHVLDRGVWATEPQAGPLDQDQGRWPTVGFTGPGWGSANQATRTETITITCTIQNTGTRAGDEVVQLYMRDVLASVARPVIELKGFRRVRLAPGAKAQVTFTLGPDDVKMLDRDMKWVVEPGTFRVMIGSSSKDLRLRGEFAVR